MEGFLEQVVNNSSSLIAYFQANKYLLGYIDSYMIILI